MMRIILSFMLVLGFLTACSDELIDEEHRKPVKQHELRQGKPYLPY